MLTTAILSDNFNSPNTMHVVDFEKTEVCHSSSVATLH